MSKEEINKISSYPQLRGADSNERRNYAQKNQRNKTKRIPHKCLRIMRKMVPRRSLRSCSVHSWSKSLCMPCNNLLAGHSAEAAISFSSLTLFFLSNNNLILARLQLLQTLPCRKHSAKYSFSIYFAMVSKWAHEKNCSNLVENPHKLYIWQVINLVWKLRAIQLRKKKRTVSMCTYIYIFIYVYVRSKYWCMFINKAFLISLQWMVLTEKRIYLWIC